MRQDELIKFPIVPVDRGGITYEAYPPHVTMGIWGAGASEYCTGVGFDGVVSYRTPHDPITGTPAESIDGCVWRAARTIVPTLPGTAPRDAQGRAIGYLIYEGLLVEHCRPVSA